jgi:hypothetical protein
LVKTVQRADYFFQRIRNSRHTRPRCTWGIGTQCCFCITELLFLYTPSLDSPARH